LSEPADTAEFLELVDKLRTRGARRVRWGSFEVELGPEPIAPRAAAPAPTPKERERTESDRYERDLFWSAGGTVPDPDDEAEAS
jgi:hypothetical protein